MHAIIGVTKHHTSVTVHTDRKHTSFRNLFMQITNILQQLASMAVPKCTNCQLHLFFTADITVLGAGAEAQSMVNLYNCSGMFFILQHFDSIFLHRRKTYM